MKALTERRRLNRLNTILAKTGRGEMAAFFGGAATLRTTLATTRRTTLATTRRTTITPTRRTPLATALRAALGVVFAVCLGVILAVGSGGFGGYFAYIYPERDIVMVESPDYGNATYVLPYSNWEELSQLTKGEVVEGRLCKMRIPHDEYWAYRVQQLMIR